MLVVKLNQRTFTFTQSALSSKVWGNGEREGGNINIWPIKLFGGVSGSALSPLGGLGLVKSRKDTINRIGTNIVHVFSCFSVSWFPSRAILFQTDSPAGNEQMQSDYAHFLSHLLSAAKTERRKDISFSFRQKKWNFVLNRMTPYSSEGSCQISDRSRWPCPMCSTTTPATSAWNQS